MPARAQGKAEPLDFVNEFLATEDGHRLMKVEDAMLRRRIVNLMEHIAGGD